MIKKINNLTSIELEKFRILYTKYFVGEAKRTELGLPLIYEIITKKNSRALADSIISQIKDGNYLGYAYIENDDVLGFIVGYEDGVDPARITEAYIVCKDEDKHKLTDKIVVRELYRKIAMAFKMKGRTTIIVEASIYNRELTNMAIANGFNKMEEYPDSYVEYEKRI